MVSLCSAARQDDWNGVAAEVGSKDAEQCVLKLLSLPLEDKTLAVLGEQKGMNPQSGTTSRQVP